MNEDRLAPAVRFLHHRLNEALRHRRSVPATEGDIELDAVFPAGLDGKRHHSGGAIWGATEENNVSVTHPREQLDEILMEFGI